MRRTSACCAARGVRVETEGARGAAQPANEKRGEKVDVFDEALARVGQRLEDVSGAE
ncbi:hypothetical protein ACNQR9_00335 [Mycolicibacterium peregrinum]